MDEEPRLVGVEAGVVGPLPADLDLLGLANADGHDELCRLDQRQAVHPRRLAAVINLGAGPAIARRAAAAEFDSVLPQADRPDRLPLLGAGKVDEIDGVEPARG